jgi:hypothetical protein
MSSGFVHEWCGLLMSWFSGSGISLFGGEIGGALGSAVATDGFVRLQ